MGGLCCCLRPELEFHPHQHRSSFFLRDCLGLRSCLPWLFNSQYTRDFDEVEHQDPDLLSTSGGGGGGPSALQVDTSIPEAFQAPPPPLPYDTSPRSLRSSHARRDKSSSGGVSQPRRNVDLEEHVKQHVPTSKAFPRVESALSMWGDDDDVCPTCLDGYTDENPRITTACCHSYHLSCIYEWMERSNRCPVCDKEMIFSESV